MSSDTRTFNDLFASLADPGEKGRLFHTFVRDLFAADYPGMASFETAGVDGAIDCYHASGMVWECKFVGEAGLQAAQRRWRGEVLLHLRNNLLPDGAKLRQYRPWYNTETPISRYLFCTSNCLKTEEKVETLEALIKADFAQLAKDAGLPHLAAIQVEVWSWEKLSPRLASNPNLHLKWFHDSRLKSSHTLEIWLRNQHRLGFRAYMTQAVLPYISLQTESLTPPAILRALQASDEAAGVLTGVGGAGKSRLLVEVARAADAQGWLVYMADPVNLAPADIDLLASMAGEGPVLIGLDYLEKSLQFEELVQALHNARLNGKQIYMLATCRLSYWPQIEHQAYLLQPFSLAQAPMAEVVRQILGPSLQEFAKDCGTVPVFAAFVRFLNDKGDVHALEQLRKEKDFRHWLISHILQIGDAHKRLSLLEQARLMMILPATESELIQLEQEVPALKAWRSALEEDGWLLLESASGAATELEWKSAHDVIADGTLLRLFDNAATRQPNLIRLLASAHACRSMASPLNAFQRISKEDSARELDWLAAFGVGVQQWCNDVEAIISSRLLDLPQSWAFLQIFQAQRERLVRDSIIQGALGAFTRELVKSAVALPTEQEVALVDWLYGAIAANGPSNFVLVQAFRWRPKLFELAAKDWLKQHTNEPQATFVFRAWREGDADFAGIKEAVLVWLSVPQNRIGVGADFVFKAWLDAKADAGQIKDAVLAWLAVPANRIAPEAQFVFKAWLDAKADAGQIKEAVLAWLTVPANRIAPEAQFVFKAWLDAKADAGQIKEAVLAWLAEPANRIAPEASFVFAAWGKARQKFDATMFAHLGAWAQQHAHLRDAHYCLRYLAADARLELPSAKSILAWINSNPTHSQAKYLLRGMGQKWAQALPDLGKAYLAVLKGALASVGRMNKSDLETVLHLFANSGALPAPNPVMPSMLCIFLRQLSPAQIADLRQIRAWQAGVALPDMVWAGLSDAIVDAGLQAPARALLAIFTATDFSANQNVMALKQQLGQTA